MSFSHVKYTHFYLYGEDFNNMSLNLKILFLSVNKIMINKIDELKIVKKLANAATI